MQSPDTDVRKSYEEWHSRYAVDVGADTPWHRLVRRYLSVERDLAGKDVLEIGCGRGGFSCWLHRFAPRLIAADFSAVAVRMGREHAKAFDPSGVKWEVTDIQAIPHAAATFDTVISCETIEHVTDPRRALAELARVLKPGGRLFLTTPNYFGGMGVYRLYLSATGRVFTEEGQPINNFLVIPRTRRWIRCAGLRVLTTQSVGHYLPFPRRAPIELRVFDRGGVLTRWFGFHSLIIAEKPAA